MTDKKLREARETYEGPSEAAHQCALDGGLTYGTHNYASVVTGFDFGVAFERARSAKLIKALKFMTMPITNKNPTIESLLETMGNDCRVGSEAIAEYEAGE